jgi:D-amino-acid dehydrogenase
MHVAVVGAGVVGLSTAWYLREQGADVTVFDKQDEGAGASWGNAGQVLPAMAVPLAEPATLRFALASFYRKNSPITAPKTFDRELVRFLVGFGKNSTYKKYINSLQEMKTLNNLALDEFQHLEAKGVKTTRREAPFTSAVTHVNAATYLLQEYADVTEHCLPVDISLLNKVQLQAHEPLVREPFNFGIQLNGQSFLDPPAFIANFAQALEKVSVRLVRNSPITSVERRQGSLRVVKSRGESESFDAVVIATGAWLSRLAHDHGVRTPIVAGVGYSMSVESPHPTRGMLYFPESRIAITAYRQGLRISSLMQMDNVDAPNRESGRERLLRTARAVLPQLHWETVGEFWSGGRPLTVDGKPMLGATATEGVYVNGGHGMWGVTLGPISGKLLAERILGQSDGRTLRNFDPLR